MNKALIAFSIIISLNSCGSQANHASSNNPNNIYCCPSTKIDYRIDRYQKVLLTTYDIEENIIDTLVNQSQEVGQYTLTPNFASYKSGIYFYKVISDDTTYSKKFILIK